MNNTNSNTTITAEQIGLPSGPIELKLGHTFRPDNHLKPNGTKDSGKSIAYHTLRYDFKPASVSDEKAHVELSQSGGVTITTPNVEGSVSSHSVFRGQRRPHNKECVLVFDRNTGEMVLHRLTDNISVKATRRGVGGGGGGNSRGDTLVSAPSSTSVGGPSGGGHSSSQKSSNNNHNSSNHSSGSNAAPSSSSNHNTSSSNHHHHHHHNNSGSSSSSNHSHHRDIGNLDVSGSHVHAFDKEPQLSESSSSSSDSSSSSSSPASSDSSSPGSNEGFYF